MSQRTLMSVGIVIFVVGLFLPLGAGPNEDVAPSMWDLEADNGVWGDGLGIAMMIVLAVVVLLIVIDRLEYVSAISVTIFWELLLSFAGVWRLVYNTDWETSFGDGWLALWIGWVLLAGPLWSTIFKRTATREVGMITVNRLSFWHRLQLLGVAILLIGFFAPIYKQGSYTHFFTEARHLGGSAYLMFIIYLVLIVLALDRNDYLWILGLIIFCIILNDIRVLYLDHQDVERFSLMWGWAVPLTGSALLILSVLGGNEKMSEAGVDDLEHPDQVI